jgi:hypothetical protein
MGNSVLMLALWADQPVHWWSDSNWWVVIIAAITAAVIGWQSWETRKAAQASRDNVGATKDSADAALLNAKALIVSERPWLLVTISVDKDDPDMFNVSALNRGNTPAILLEGHCSVGIEAYGFRPPDELMDPFYLPLQNLIVSGDSFPVRKFKPDSVFAKRPFTDAEVPMLFVFGRIAYWDTFIDRNAEEAKPYITQWCWTFNPVKKEFFQTANSFTIYT